MAGQAVWAQDGATTKTSSKASKATLLSVILGAPWPAAWWELTHS